MRFSWDAAKNATNMRTRGLDFADAREMCKHPMLVKPDTRWDYGEVRQLGFGYV